MPAITKHIIAAIHPKFVPIISLFSHSLDSDDAGKIDGYSTSATLSDPFSNHSNHGYLRRGSYNFIGVNLLVCLSAGLCKKILNRFSQNSAEKSSGGASYRAKGLKPPPPPVFAAAPPEFLCKVKSDTLLLNSEARNISFSETSSHPQTPEVNKIEMSAILGSSE